MLLTALVKEIIDQNLNLNVELQTLNQRHEDLVGYIANDATDGEVEETLKDTSIIIDSFTFNLLESNDYELILNRFKSITFRQCEFKVKSLHLETTEVYFQQKCIFHADWYIQGLHNDKNGTIFHDCIFKKYIYSSNHEVNKKVFHSCTFNKNLEFSGVIFKASIFEGRNTFKDSNLKLFECTFNEKFILNRVNLNHFRASDCLFNNKFEFKDNDIRKFQLENTNFKKLVDTFNTNFKNFSIIRCIFDDFVAFENCMFGGHNTTLFRYATFLSFVNFRKTTFHTGLDIKNINLKESPNFLETKVAFKGTPRETFRIIKHSFEKIGNNIEANTFFVKEMEKYKEELYKDKKSKKSDKIILFLNDEISNFGQSYIKPIKWIILTAILFMFVTYAHEHNYLYQFSPEINKTINSLVSKINEFSSSILPFSKFLIKGIEFISLIFYIIFTSLIWQTIVAIKRHTKK